MKLNYKDVLKGMQYYSKYINDHSEVEHILFKKEFEINFKSLSENRYNYIVKIDGVRFAYFEGIGNDKMNPENAGEKVINLLNCLLIDNTYYNYDIDNFYNEMGYKKVSEAINTLKAISKNHDKLLKVFTPEELEILSNNIQL